MRSLQRIAVAGLLSIVAAGPVLAAKPTTVKLATLAPDGSPWHKALMQMGADWRDETDGRVVMRVYPGGVIGDDPDMVRKMRIGQIHAATLTVTGLADIDRSFNLFSIPLFFDSFAEHVHVRDRLTPLLRRRLQDEGYVLLNWGHGGWIHFFSKQPVRTVQDLRRTKIFAWAGDDSMSQGWKANGFHPVSLSITDALTGLETGMIDTIPSTPLAVLSMQWFRHMPYMLDHPIAPLVGATVITRKKWQSLTADDRAVLLEAAARSQAILDVEIPAKDLQSVEEMKKRGLTVVEAGGVAELEEWRPVADSFSERMRRGVADEVFEAAVRFRREFRERPPAGDPP